VCFHGEPREIPTQPVPQFRHGRISFRARRIYVDVSAGKTPVHTISFSSRALVGYIRKSNMRHARWIGFALLTMSAFAASCSEETAGSNVQNPTPSGAGTGGSSSVVTLTGGRDTAGGEAGSAGQSGGSEMKCGEFAGLTDCGGTTLGATLKTVNVLLVIDKSGSMTDQPEGFDENKWDSVVAALDQVLNDVAPVLNLGLLMYPYSTLVDIPLESCGDNCCLLQSGTAAINVPISDGVDAVERILPLLADTPPGGGTPTAEALRRAREYLTESGLEGDSYVLLATDGGPNCNFDLECEADRCTANLDDQCPRGNCCDGNGEYCVDDEDVTNQIEELEQAGIKTFVVGIPGTEQYAEYLSAFADAGGVPNQDPPPSYYAVSAEGGLEGLVSVFREVTEQLVRSCEVELEREAPAPGLVNVAVDCKPLRPMEDDGSGWELDADRTPNVIEISGPICEEIQTSGAKRVDVVFGCKTIE
jgi:hypothetical protein